MYLVAIAWLYVALMMSVAEANHPTGTLFGSLITFVLYGLLPVALVLYLMGTPQRRRTIKAREAAERAAARAAETSPTARDVAGNPVASTGVTSEPTGVIDPDAGRQPATAATGHGVAPVRKKP
jgi:hypothetical protein